jgi:hypothetical protein
MRHVAAIVLVVLLAAIGMVLHEAWNASCECPGCVKPRLRDGMMICSSRATP